MKSKTLMFVTTMTLSVALALPLQLAAQHTRYKLIDIGTLGGLTSYVGSGNGPGYQFLNNAGTVAGSADTSTPDPNAPNFCFNPDCFVSHAFRWRHGVVADLGALPGVNSSGAGTINGRGWIAGISENGEIDPLTGGPVAHAVLWQNDQITDLGTLPGGFESNTVDINNEGQVIGFSTINAISDPFSFLGGSIHPFLWERGVMQDLGTLGGPDALALSVNERGQVAGVSFTNATPNATTGIPTQDPFLWENGTMIDLGTLGGTVGGQGAQGSIKLNNRGQVIGTSNLAGDLVTHPFLWTKSRGMEDLGTLGGDNGFALWINDADEIVGEADLPGSAVTHLHHAFLWRNGVMTDLGTLGSTSHAEVINSRAQVVGRSRVGSAMSVLQHAFLWEDGGPMIDLNTVIPANSSLQLVDAVNINDRGEILGVGLPPGVPPTPFPITGEHLFLLIPCGASGSQSCEDNAGAATVATQNNLAPITSPITSVQSRPTPSGMAAWRARLAQRYHIPGLGTPKD